MRFTSFVAAGIAALATSSSALPIFAVDAEQFPPLQVTDLTLQSAPSGNTTIHFRVYDPSPNSGNATHCSGAWSTKSGYAVGQYTSCTKSEFEWTFLAYNGTQSFKLATGHSYEDNNVGQPPYNYVTTFAQAAVNSTNLQCTESYSLVSCRQPKDTIISLPIYALTA